GGYPYRRERAEGLSFTRLHSRPARARPQVRPQLRTLDLNSQSLDEGGRRVRISRITVWQMDLPLTKPYWLSGGRLRFDKLDTTFVRVDTDEGISGWGEGCPWGHTYLPAHGPGIRAGIETLAPFLIGADPLALDWINHLMDVQLPGHLYVKS